MALKSRFHRFPIRTTPRSMYEYYVSGRGLFPFDMLRYDSCWPASGEDAARLGDLVMGHHMGLPSGTPVTGTPAAGSHTAPHRNVSVKLRSYSEPTIERWISFGWSVGTEKL